MCYLEELKRWREIYNNESMYYRVPHLPEAVASLGDGKKRLLVRENRVELYVFYREFWRLKLRVCLPEASKVQQKAKKITVTAAGYEETLQEAFSEEEQELYFLRTVTVKNTENAPVEYNAEQKMQYFPEGPFPEFTYASYKWICRGSAMEEYFRPELEKDFMGNGCNNQLFYSFGGDVYLGAAHMDLSHNWLTVPGRDHLCWLKQSFRLYEPLMLAPGEAATFSFALFAGVGPEESVGKLSNILWNLNNPPLHVPQADMKTFLDQYYSVWKKAELTGYAPADHYAAHFFVNFYGNYKNGHYTDDQFGCSWLSYDLLKADYHLRLFERTGDASYLEKARGIVDFYCYHHYIGNSKLNYSFHTGDFMKTCPPYPAEAGWGAPLDARCLDSLAQSEMIYDALVIYEKYPQLFRSNYPMDIMEDVLKLQQPDGHFCRRYDDCLKPLIKPGWIDQTYESQSWIPTLLKLYQLTGRRECMDAALLCGQAAGLDLERKGLFAMGGSETDYPTYWDIDGFRSMLRAMLALYDATQDEQWLAYAEKSQQLSSCMAMGYNHPVPEDTFYHSIGWKTTGMIATSYYGNADYVRSFCTPSGNQTVVWVAYLLMQLYERTGKKIYADRAVAGMRQVMVYRNEESLAGKPYMNNLLYTIFENNPQIDDPSGGYKAGVAQDGYSMFIDVYVYLDDILRDFGGIYLDEARNNIFGLDCVKIESVDYGAKCFTVTNELNKTRTVLLKQPGKEKVAIELKGNETRTVNW